VSRTNRFKVIRGIDALQQAQSAREQARWHVRHRNDFPSDAEWGAYCERSAEGFWSIARAQVRYARQLFAHSGVFS